MNFPYIIYIIALLGCFLKALTVIWEQIGFRSRQSFRPSGFTERFLPVGPSIMSSFSQFRLQRLTQLCVNLFKPGLTCRLLAASVCLPRQHTQTQTNTHFFFPSSFPLAVFTIVSLHRPSLSGRIHTICSLPESQLVSLLHLYLQISLSLFLPPFFPLPEKCVVLF